MAFSVNEGILLSKLGAISLITCKSDLTDGRYQCRFQSPDTDKNNRWIILFKE